MSRIEKKVKSQDECMFRWIDGTKKDGGFECHARPKTCTCKPEPGHKFPRRCPLRSGPVIVKRAEVKGK